jgi:hypothetical protein
MIRLLKIFMVVRIVFRFLSGRPMSGERKTNATFFLHATTSLDPSGHAHRWEMIPGYQRALWRLAGLYVVVMLSTVGILWPFLRFDPPWWLNARIILITNVTVIGSVILWRIIRSHIRDHGMKIVYPVREWRQDSDPDTDDPGRKVWTWRMWELQGRAQWEKDVILPIGRALAPQLNIPRTDRAIRQVVRIPRDFHDGGIGEVLLPDSFTGADAATERRIIRTVQARLGLREKDPVVVDFSLGGAHPRMTFHLPEKLPTLVRMTDVRMFLEAQGEWDFLYGMSRGGEVFSVSITGDTPHMALSAGSGAGKSELLKGVVAQAGRKGWFVIILDWKGESQEWAKGLDGVRYVTSTEAIHDMCVQIGEEIDYRKTLPKDHPKARTLIVAEEWGITAPLLAEYWSMLRSTADPEERRTMPLRSPALTAMMKLVFTGRSLGLFEALVAQRFSARVTNGNADLRESFQVIMMARWKPQTVKMLAPDVKPFPKKPKELGRWVAVDGETAVIYQAVLWTDAEAREWFTSGEPIPASPWMVRGGVAGLPVDMQHNTLEDQLPLGVTGGSQDVIEAEVVDERKLSEMVEGLAPLGITLKILQHAANGGDKADPDFPSPVSGSPNRGYRYDYSAVRTWARKRHSARLAERIGK